MSNLNIYKATSKNLAQNWERNDKHLYEIDKGSHIDIYTLK